MRRSRAALEAGPGGLAVRWLASLYLVVLVGLPLAAVVAAGLRDGMDGLWEAVSHPMARSALWLTLWTGFVVAVINGVLGTATAWVFVRYEFPGRAALAALVDLPFAIPTLVAGLMLVALYGPQEALGSWFSDGGHPIIFAPAGIIIALLFVTLPFVVRAVEPVLLELDPAEEEAAATLGASPLTTFRRVTLPALLPAAVSGAIRSMGRALGEFGSIVVVAGNIPFETLTGPVYIFGEIESGQPRSAAAVSIVLLAAAVILHRGARFVEERLGVVRG